MLKIVEAFLYKVNEATEEMGERREGPKIKKEPGMLIIRIIGTMANSRFRVFHFKKNRPHYVSFILAYSKWKIHMQ